MMNDSFVHSEALDTNLVSKSSSNYGYPMHTQFPVWSLRWGLHQDMNPEPVAYGQVDFLALASRLASLLKLERQHRERLAAIWLDPTAQKLLGVLDKETSLPWEDLPDRTEGDWSEAAKSAALLAGANLCEVSPTRIRLNEYGDKLLAESSLTHQVNPEVAS